MPLYYDINNDMIQYIIKIECCLFIVTYHHKLNKYLYLQLKN